MVAGDRDSDNRGGDSSYAVSTLITLSRPFFPLRDGAAE